MQTSIESFLIMNFLFDAIVLTIVSKASDRFRTSRVLSGALITCAFSLPAVSFPGKWNTPAMHLLLLVPVSMLVSGCADIRVWFQSAVMLISAAVITGGCDALIAGFAGRKASAFASTGAGLMLLYILTYFKRTRRIIWTVELCVSVKGRTTRFHALIDTGNRLHEPLSGLPVIIAERQLVESILPETGYRNVSFGGLGGNGTLKCFRPDYIWIASGRRFRRTPDAWIAVSPAPLPGINRALAPAEFASL